VTMISIEGFIPPFAHAVDFLGLHLQPFWANPDHCLPPVLYRPRMPEKPVASTDRSSAFCLVG
jgi:hypothetical protein